MGAAVREYDWSGTPLGVPPNWPPALRTLVGVMLASTQPMFLAWGPDQTWLYNDAFIPILGRKHPDALGRPALEVWAEAKDTLQPLFAQVFAGQAVHLPDINLMLDRHGRLEEAHFAFSYTPARDATGAVVGLFGACIETTERVCGERRHALMVKLSDRFRDLRDEGELSYAVGEFLGTVLGVDRAGYGTVDPRKKTITIVRDWNAPGVKSLAGVLNFLDYGSYIDDLIRGETVVFADAHHDPRTRTGADALAAITATAAINLPVIENGQLVALLYLNHGSPRDWLPADLELLQEVAERARAVIERRRAEQALRELARTQEALRQAQKMEAVGQLTGGLAHDFNNLLAGVSGSLEVVTKLTSQGKFDKVERYLQMAQGATRRAAALTQRLLAFSRQQTLDPKPTDVNRLVGGMEELIRRTVGPSVTVEVVGAGGLWPTLVDQSQLESALLNLCLNARDAMAPEGGRLTVETANKWLDDRAAAERDLPAGQYVSLCVTDTGTGMTPEVIARAFDPFFTTKPIGQGTGLGLSMAYGFARQSGGQIRIYSEIAKGTTICIYLPRHLGALEPVVAESNERPPGLGDGETVLVIDDEPTMRILISDVLEELGYRPLVASDGPSGLKILQSSARIDLLITDVGLPGGMNGRQIADAARVSRPGLKVLFITGYAENAAVGNGFLDAGMEILTKPFAMALLAVRIQEMLAP